MKRILREFQLDKIAVVDRPCQELALVTIMKRAPATVEKVNPELLERARNFLKAKDAQGHGSEARDGGTTSAMHQSPGDRVANVRRMFGTNSPQYARAISSLGNKGSKPGHAWDKETSAWRSDVRKDFQLGDKPPAKVKAKRSATAPIPGAAAFGRSAFNSTKRLSGLLARVRKIKERAESASV